MNIKYDNNEYIENLIEENKILHSQIERLKNALEDARHSARHSQINEIITTNPLLDIKIKTYEYLLKSILNKYENMPRRNPAPAGLLKKIVRGDPKINEDELAQKVKTAYDQGQISGLKKMISDINLDADQISKVLTRLAKEHSKDNCEATAEIARLAWEIDPRIYRLKWLAFQVEKAGHFLESSSMLELINQDRFSDKEKEKIKKIEEKVNKIINQRLEVARNVKMPAVVNKLTETEADNVSMSRHLKEIQASLKEMGEARAREISFLLDCLDEHKQIIKQSSNEAFLNSIAKIREIVEESSGVGVSEEFIRNFTAKTAINEYFGNNKYSNSLISLSSSPDELEYAISLINVINSLEYNYITEFGSGLSTYYAMLALHNDDLLKNKCIFKSFSADKTKIRQIKSEIAKQISDGDQIIKYMPFKYYIIHNESFEFYDCADTIKTLSGSEKNHVMKKLFIVNKPSETVQNFNPYPLLGIILKNTGHNLPDILLNHKIAQRDINLIEKWRTVSEALNIEIEIGKIDKNENILLKFHEIQ